MSIFARLFRDNRLQNNREFETELDNDTDTFRHGIHHHHHHDDDDDFDDDNDDSGDDGGGD